MNVYVLILRPQSTLTRTPREPRITIIYPGCNSSSRGDARPVIRARVVLVHMRRVLADVAAAAQHHHARANHHGRVAGQRGATGASGPTAACKDPQLARQAVRATNCAAKYKNGLAHSHGRVPVARGLHGQPGNQPTYRSAGPHGDASPQSRGEVVTQHIPEDLGRAIPPKDPAA